MNSFLAIIWFFKKVISFPASNSDKKLSKQ